MSVNLVSLRLYDEYIGKAGGDGVNYLYGNVGDKIHAELIFEVAWSTENKSLNFSSGNRSITRDSSSGSFITDGFKIGDTFDILGAASNSGTKTITGMTSTVLFVQETLSDEIVTCSIHGTTPITAIDYYYNCIENSNSENYTSLVDANTQQKWNVNDLSTSVTGTTKLMTVATKSKGWSNGSAQIKTIHFNGYKQRLQIDHWFHITPIFLSDQLINFQTKISPDYFKGIKCFRYIAKVDAKFTNSDATIPHTSTFSFNDNLGNTGWLDENYNLGIDPFYTFESILYTNSTGGTEQVAVIDKPTSVEVIINAKDASDARAFATGCTFIVNHIYQTLDQTDYIDTPNIHKEAFRWDRVSVNGWINPVNRDGENFGTEFQSIVDASAEILSETTARVNFTIDLNPTYKEFLKARDTINRNYAIFIGVGTSVTGTTKAHYHNTILCQ